MTVEYDVNSGLVVARRSPIEGERSTNGDSLLYKVEGERGIAKLVDDYDMYAGLEEKGTKWPTNEIEMLDLQRQDEKWGPKIEELESRPDTIILIRGRYQLILEKMENGDKTALRLKDTKMKQSMKEYLEDENVVALPKVLTKMALTFEHEGKAHPGRNRMAASIALRYYWEGMGEQVREHVANCKKCQHRKSANLGVKIPVLHVRKRARPWYEIHIDLIVELPETASGFKHILVVKDSLTKFVIMEPLKTKTATEVGRAMVDEIYCKFGAAQIIYSDRGKEFHNQTHKAINYILRQRQQFTTAYHPQANGQVENQNRTIKDALAAYINLHHNDWDIFLPLITHAYNTTINDATGFSPFRALFGREARQPTDSWMKEAIGTTEIGFSDYVSKLQTVLIETWGVIQEAIERGYDKTDERLIGTKNRRIFRPFQEGEMVFVRTIPKLEFASDELEKKYKLASKLQARYTGPHKIIRVINPTTYMVKFENGKEHAIHATKLKRDPAQLRKRREYDFQVIEQGQDGEDEPLIMEIDEEDNMVVPEGYEEYNEENDYINSIFNNEVMNDEEEEMEKGMVIRKGD